MAYTSFTLRKNNVSAGNGGSALRRDFYTQDSSTPAGSGTAAYDSGLKSDNFIVPVPSEYLESSFQADVYRRDQIQLRWELETALVTTLTASFQPTKIVIRASNDGEPTTPQEGFFVVSVDGNNYFEKYTDQYSAQRTYIQAGRWVYYSMFVYYENNTGESYYERVAILSVQIPYDFGSTAQLWRHVPTYYRELDASYVASNPTYAYEQGPLYRFIELFGWELDKFRTTIYDTMRINDPQVIHSSAIDALADQVGVEFTKDVLGTTKLRAVLNNIGYLRRTKGTLNSIVSYISALSGCGVSVDESTFPVVFNVHPHRVNLFTDPQFSNAATGTGNLPTFHKTFTDLDSSGREYGWGVFVDYTTGSLTPTVTTTSNTLTITIPASSDTATVWVYSRGVFDYNNDLVYYASALSSHDFDLRFALGSSVFSQEASGSSLGLVYADDWNDSTPSSSFPTFIHPTRKIVASIPWTTAPLNPLDDIIPVMKFTVALNPSASTVITVKDPLIEYRNSSGEYFDGDEPLGGFIPDATGSTVGTYDYHWGPNADSTSGTHFSFFTSDYYRSKEVTNNIIADYVVPLTASGSTYTINWDVIE